MKKTYITPAVDIINNDLNQSILNASIHVEGEKKQLPTDTTDPEFVVGAKSSNSLWDDELSIDMDD